MVQIIALCVVLLRLVCASSRHSLTDDDGRITFKEAFPLPNDNEGQVLRKSAKDKCKKKFSRFEKTRTSIIGEKQTGLSCRCFAQDQTIFSKVQLF